jgi:hypothetical protein
MTAAVQSIDDAFEEPVSHELAHVLESLHEQPSSTEEAKSRLQRVVHAAMLLIGAIDAFATVELPPDEQLHRRVLRRVVRDLASVDGAIRLVVNYVPELALDTASRSDLATISELREATTERLVEVLVRLRALAVQLEPSLSDRFAHEVVLTDASVRRVLERIAQPPAPTSDLIELVKGRSDW